MLTQLSPEVFAATQPVSRIGMADIVALKVALAASPRGRVRINLHPDNDDLLHEMIIAIDASSYIRPHKHPGKSEAFHLLYGTVDIAILSDDGELTDVIALGADDPGRAFYYRMSQPFFHTLIIYSDVLVVHEITNGPFVPSGTIQASFAPTADDAAAAIQYQTELRERVAAFNRARQ
jgi:cupin fold WbuC family metalloprotein